MLSVAESLSPETKYKYLSLLLFLMLLIVSSINLFVPSSLPSSSHHHPRHRVSCSSSDPLSNYGDDKEESTHPLVSLLFGAIFLSICGWVARRSFLFCSKEFNIFLETKNRQNRDEFSEMEYFLYRLDYLYSHDEKFKPAALFSAAISLIFIGGCLWWVSTEDSLIESFWAAWKIGRAHV